jgi:hypothetical protein
MPDPDAELDVRYIFSFWMLWINLYYL